MKAYGEIKKIGNSHHVLIPSWIMKSLKLEEGDAVTFDIELITDKCPQCGSDLIYTELNDYSKELSGYNYRVDCSNNPYCDFGNIMSLTKGRIKRN